MAEILARASAGESVVAAMWTAANFGWYVTACATLVAFTGGGAAVLPAYEWFLAPTNQ